MTITPSSTSKTQAPKFAFSKLLARQQMWWYGLVLLLAFATRFMFYDYSLPYVENMDETNLYLLANDWRGELDGGYRADWLEGYPPGYLWFSSIVMDAIDATLETNIHIDMAVYIRILRFIAFSADFVTILALMYAVYKLAGHHAALLAGTIWALSAYIVFNAITALTDSYMMMFCALTVASSIVAIQKISYRYAYLSTICGLLAIIFKYPAFPFMLFPASCFLFFLRRHRIQALLPSAIALGMVAMVGFYLIEIYGAFKLDVGEAQNFRNYSIYLDRGIWILSFENLLQLTGIGILISACISAVKLLIDRNWSAGKVPIILFVVNVLIFAIVPLYLKPDATYLFRYPWPQALLFVGFGSVIIFKAFSKPLVWIVATIPIVTLLPTLINQLVLYEKPHTYYFAQSWIIDNITEDMEIAILDYRSLRSILRYESGYSGFVQVDGFYTDQRIPDNIANYDLVYFNEATTFIPVPTSEWTLVKHIPEEGRRGGDIFMYLPRHLPNEQQTRLRIGDIVIEIRGLSVITDNDSIDIDSYFSAPQQPPQQDFSYFLHLTPKDDRANIIAQSDGQIGWRATSTWTDPTELIRGNIADFAMPELPPGEYTLLFGIYDWESGCPPHHR